MKKIIETVKSAMSRLAAWAFENDKVTIDRRFVTYTGNFRR